ncbi:transporter substrate-binding domain-containing protein [Planktomarina temperata]|jgi:polar amino acid transport system substrate-binding protein|nr:transporter substrate-binding domain-containing protein [Paracoccaceae bacterium]MDA8540993.1 transporter substrate-binding domain-containing protein [Planktomarina temperata]MDA8987545.1 transporter substrate-binding domain-containing protein [Planktomarina temperata]MDC0381984.1 transporter substrate-binding domain-containing protein [Planktomarina temperata]
MIQLERRRMTKGLLACATAFALCGPVVAQSVLDMVTSGGKITVATEVAYPPMEFLKDGKVVGYGKDILDLIVADMGVELEQLQLPWDGILAGVLAGKYDLVATSVAIKEDRVSKYAFTRPLAVAETMLVKRHGDDSMTSLDDVNGKVIGVELGSSQAQEVEATDAELKANGGAGFADIRGFKSTDDMRLALVGGQIDIGTIPSFSLATMQEQRPDTFAQLTNIGSGTLFAWVAHPDGADLRDRVNAALEKLEQEGTLKELQMKWFGFEMDLPEDYLPEGAL